MRDRIVIFIIFRLQQGKSGGFDSCDWPSNLAQIGLIFQVIWPWNLTYDPEKQQGTSSMFLEVYVLFHGHPWIQTGVSVQKCWIRVKVDTFCPMWLWHKIWRMTLKNNRAPLLCRLSFVHHFLAICELKLLSIVMTPWRYYKRNIEKKVWQVDRWTDRRTDGYDRSQGGFVTAKNDIWFEFATVAMAING